MTGLTNLELKVMQMLLDGNDDVLAGLRRQLDACKVSKRELTGFGFFTTFEVPANVARLPNGKSFKFGDVNATISGLEHGAGFLLYVKEGFLEMLEGYSYDEPWPEEVTSFDMSYDKGYRDWSVLKKMWA